ncbi:MAG: diguanylate cyclase [Desulfuromonadales bacterium]
MDVKFSLKSKITLTLALFFFVTLVIIATAALEFFEKKLSSIIAEQQFAIVSEIAAELDSEISEARKLIVATAATIPPSLVENPDRAQEFLDSRLGVGAHQRFDNGIFLFSAKGTMVAESPVRTDRRGTDYSYRQYFQRTLATEGPVISDPYLSSQKHHHPAVNFTAPITDGGRVVGVLAGSVDLTEDNFLGRISTTRIGETGYLYLFNTDRLMIMHPNKSRVLQKDVPPGANIFYDRAIKGFEGTGETVNSRGLHTLVTFKHLENVDWIVAANYPIDEAYAPIYSARSYIIIGLAVLMGFGTIVVWLYIRYLTKPLSDFTSYIDCLLRDETPCQDLEIRTNDEIGVLATVFKKLMRDLEEEKNFTYNLVQNSAVPCFVLDRNHKVLIWTSACEKLTGIEASQMVGTDRQWSAFYPESRPVLADLILDGELGRVVELYSKFSNSLLVPEGLQAEGWFEQVGGKQRYLFFEAAPVRNNGGELIAAIETIQDITNLKHTEEALRETGESYRALMEHSPDAILVHSQGSVIVGNQAAVELFGADDVDDLPGTTVMQLVHPDDRDQVRQRISNAQYEHQKQPYTEIKIMRLDGTVLDVEVGSMPTRYGGETAVQTILRDITQRKKAQEEIWVQANFDSLTDLPNRNLFFDRLKQTLHRAEREGSRLGVFYIDLDGFKEINDTHGHHSGDVLLQKVGTRLLRSTRKTDTVTRLGGDEFAVILTPLPNPDILKMVAERIITSVSVPFSLPFGEGEISASLGIAVFPDDGKKPVELLEAADRAMYRAKEKGKNRYVFSGQ